MSGYASCLHASNCWHAAPIQHMWPVRDDIAVRLDQVENVITQVTRRDQLPAPNQTAPYPKATEQDGVDGRITWKGKLRSLLCCLAPPQNDRYFRSNEAEAVVVRPPPRALPPPRPAGVQAYNTTLQHAQRATCSMHALAKWLSWKLQHA